MCMHKDLFQLFQLAGDCSLVSKVNGSYNAAFQSDGSYNVTKSTQTAPAPECGLLFATHQHHTFLNQPNHVFVASCQDQVITTR